MSIDGVIAVNVTDLCFHHHEELESRAGGCPSRLRWINGSWAWYDRYLAERDKDKELILYKDLKTDVNWKLVGFLQGDYVVDTDSITTGS